MVLHRLGLSTAQGHEEVPEVLIPQAFLRRRKQILGRTSLEHLVRILVRTRRALNVQTLAKMIYLLLNMAGKQQ